MTKLIYILPGLILLLSNTSFAKKAYTYKKSCFCKQRNLNSPPIAEKEESQDLIIITFQNSILSNGNDYISLLSQSFSTNNISTNVQARAPPSLS